MILQMLKVMDIGYLGKQRLLLKVLADGNLLGYHLLQADNYFYSFPHWEAKRGDYVVLYINSGERKTVKFADATCHFLYYGKRLRLWEEQADTFHLVFRINQ